jgi:hypothetical protein
MFMKVHKKEIKQQVFKLNGSPTDEEFVFD